MNRGGFEVVSRKRLRSTWHRRWSPAIEEAVRAIPDTQLCPHDLYLTLLQMNISQGGRVAVVTDEGAPAAVVGLRREGRLRWRNLTSWILPGFVGAVSDEMVLPALASLNTEIALPWWRLSVKPEHPSIRTLREAPVNRVDLDKAEAYWRSSKMWATITRARRKCEGLEVHVDAPGDAEWIIRSEARKWNPERFETDVTVEAKVEIARQLAEAGRYVTVTLRDGDQRLAGVTTLIDGSTAVSGILYRDESVGSLPTGVRVLDEIFSLSRERGLVDLDLGYSYPYKNQWAPQDGTVYDVIVSPPLHDLTHRAIDRLRRPSGGGDRTDA